MGNIKTIVATSESKQTGFMVESKDGCRAVLPFGDLVSYLYFKNQEPCKAFEDCNSGIGDIIDPSTLRNKPKQWK